MALRRNSSRDALEGDRTQIVRSPSSRLVRGLQHLIWIPHSDRPGARLQGWPDAVLDQGQKPELAGNGPGQGWHLVRAMK
jgi:hypothetical protein